MKILERDFTGYGKEPPNPNWPKKSRLAINFVINVEEQQKRGSGLCADQAAEDGQRARYAAELSLIPENLAHIPFRAREAKLARFQ